MFQIANIGSSMIRPYDTKNVCMQYHAVCVRLARFDYANVDLILNDELLHWMCVACADKYKVHALTGDLGR